MVQQPVPERSVNSLSWGLFAFIGVIFWTGMFGFQPAVGALSPEGLSVERLKNATLDCYRAPLHFRDGVAHVEGGDVRLIESPIAFANLDSDGDEDVAVLLASSLGGSGTWLSLHAIVDVDGAPVCRASIALGDRTQVRALRADSGRVHAALTLQSGDDPMCCPSLHADVEYVLQGNRWIEVGLPTDAVVFHDRDDVLGKLLGIAIPENVKAATESLLSASNPPHHPPLVHPFDLARNPFQFGHEPILLDPSSYPRLVQGRVHSWQPGFEPAGQTGLRFQRFWAEGEALYEVTGVDLQGSGTQFLPMGYLVVRVPAQANSGSPIQPPSLSRGPWLVRPIGTAQGTNNFGAPVVIPVVQLCGEDRCAEQQQVSAAPTPAKKGIGIRDPNRDIAASVHPYDLLQNPFLHRGDQVLLDAYTASAVGPGGRQPWAPGVSGFQFEKMLDARRAVYEVMAMDLADPRAGIHPIGQLVVMVPDNIATNRGCSGHAGPLCAAGSTWVVEPLGSMDGVNALGGQVQVPAVRYVRAPLTSELEERAKVER